MKTSTKWLITGGIAATALAAGGIAHAKFHHSHKDYYGANPLMHDTGHGHHGKKGMHLKALDTDDDNLISEDEMLAAVRMHFDKLDSNGDGSIGFEEFSIKPLERFTKMDANSDMMLDKSELKKHRKYRRHGHHHDMHHDDSNTEQQS